MSRREKISCAPDANVVCAGGHLGCEQLGGSSFDLCLESSPVGS